MSKGRYKTFLIVMAVLIVLSACSGNELIFGEGEDADSEMETVHSDASPPIELFGNSLRGGLIYDNWWKVLGNNAPTQNHPLWATQDTNTRTGGDTWRCKECHGWDYKGADGAYGSGSHFTGFPGVLAAAGSSSTDLTGWLDGSANPDHDFTDYLDDESIDALVAFIQRGMVNMSDYINDEDKSAIGDAAVGQPLFNTSCAPCHGLDGASINFGDSEEPVYLGDLAWENPWETMHKAANGQPGSLMPSGLALGWNWEDIADVLAYLQTLTE